MYQITAKVSGASGVVTAFYLRNDLQNETSDGKHDEIDFEFLNGNPAPPQSLWLNTYKDGRPFGEKMLMPGEYQALLKTTSTTGDWMTYTINWQQGFVSWLVNGQVVFQYEDGIPYYWRRKTETPEPFSSPKKPSHINLSIWTANGGFQNFGGKLDTSQPEHRSYFKDLRRILCDEGPAEPLPPVALTRVSPFLKLKK
jgi:beta-glucanase (GH16 family)